MKWKPEYSVGLAEIDEQHKILIDCITAIESAMNQEERWSAVHFSIGRLDDYVRIHFSVEESLMRICAYPDFERHAEQHRQFEIDLKRLYDASLAQDASVEMVRYLRQWFARHVMESDQEYARYFRSVAAPRRPFAATRVARWIRSRLCRREAA